MMLLAAALCSVQTSIAQASDFSTLAACKIDEENVVCWAKEGTLNPDLSKEIRRRLEENKVEVGFRPNRQSRYLIVRHSANLRTSYTAPTGSVASFYLGTDQGNSLFALRTDIEPKVTEVSLMARIGRRGTSTKTLNFGERAQFELDGVGFEFGAIQKSNGIVTRNFLFGYGLPWTFAVSPLDANGQPDLSLVALDGRGQPIRYVNEQGMPLDTANGDAIFKTVAEGKWDWRTTPPAEQLLFTFQPGPVGIQWCLTNANPKGIRSIAVWQIISQRQTLGPFPIEPKRDSD